MSALVIGDNEKAAIKKAMADARARPIPLTVMRKWSTELPQDIRRVVTAAESEAARKNRPAAFQVFLPVNYRLAISFEEQPAGLMAHLSVSLDVHERMPHPIAVEMILRECGFSIDPASNKPPAVGHWIEEYLLDGKPSGKALNFLFMVEAREAPERVQ